MSEMKVYRIRNESDEELSFRKFTDTEDCYIDEIYILPDGDTYIESHKCNGPEHSNFDTSLLYKLVYCLKNRPKEISFTRWHCDIDPKTYKLSNEYTVGVDLKCDGDDISLHFNTQNHRDENTVYNKDYYLNSEKEIMGLISTLT